MEFQEVLSNQHVQSGIDVNTSLHGHSVQYVNGYSCAYYYYLICINKDYFLDTEWEQDIKKQDLVAPDNPLFLSLSMKPPGPLVLHQLILKTITFCHCLNEVLIGS